MRKVYFDKLTKIIDKNNLDAMLIVPSEELQFIIGHSPHLCGRFQGLFVKRDGGCFYICNLLTADEMKNVLGENIKVYSWFDGEIFTDIVNKAFKENDLIGKVIGVNSTARAFNILQIMDKMDVKFIDGKPILEELRIIKTDEELENLKMAAKITDEVFKELVKHIKPGLKEVDIANIIRELFKEKGGQPRSNMVSSGPNSGLPHYNGNQRVIQEKDIVLLDFGCKYKGMCSDMTRTIFVGGISEEEKKVYELVLEANLAAESKVAPGVFVPDIDRSAREIIEKAGYGKYFTTRLGHGIGYSVHEAPDIKKSNPMNLSEGMAFSIEPGVYMAGKFGIRIEDIVTVTKNGIEVLNQSSKEIIIV